jgi:AraC-like DNA-binding protein
MHDCVDCFLRAAQAMTTAASAAFEVGYESPTQFNREYSRFFGQPPIRDVRALRESATRASEPTNQQIA